MRNAFDYLKLPDPGNIARAFEEGLDQGRKTREEREVKSALSAYAVNPEDEGAFQKLAQYRPELAIQIGQDRRKQQQQALVMDLQGRAAQGDKAALAQLAGIDLNAWDKIGDNQRQQIAKQVDFVGNAALAVSRLPPEQRPAAWDSYIQQGVAAGFTDLAQYQGRYSDEALNGALAQAGMIKQFIDMNEPKYQVVPEGGALVNTNDPAAVQSYVNGMAPQASPGGAVAAPASKAEFDALPPGTQYRAPDGSMRIKGGGAGNGTGNFRPVDGSAVVKQMFPSARITSGYRGPNHPLSRKNPRSWHAHSRGAVDVAPIPGMTFGQFVKRFRDAGYQILEERDEVKNPSSHATGPHWHIVIGGR